MMLMRLGQTTACSWLIPHRVRLIRGVESNQGANDGLLVGEPVAKPSSFFHKIVPEYQRAAWFSFSESISALTSSEKRRTQRPEAISFAPPTWRVSPFLHQRSSSSNQRRSQKNGSGSRRTPIFIRRGNDLISLQQTA